MTGTWLVVDCQYNREHYAGMIGQTFEVAPSYARVQFIPAIESLGNMFIPQESNLMKVHQRKLHEKQHKPN